MRSNTNAVSNNAVHALRNEVAEKTKHEQTRSNHPEPVQILDILSRNETYKTLVNENSCKNSCKS